MNDNPILHEAGHFVVNAYFGGITESIYVSSDIKDRGGCKCLNYLNSPFAHIIIAAGLTCENKDELDGLLAECNFIHGFEYFKKKTTYDEAKLVEKCQKKIKRYYQAFVTAKKIIDANQSLVDAVVQALEQKKRAITTYQWRVELNNQELENMLQKYPVSQITVCLRTTSKIAKQHYSILKDVLSNYITINNDSNICDYLDSFFDPNTSNKTEGIFDLSQEIIDRSINDKMWEQIVTSL